ncbi:MAG: hypothetical protein J4F31_10650 [Flavobacteriales bacterium]|nr:hypothetical protein [Flavobacteriales bacterium]
MVEELNNGAEGFRDRSDEDLQALWQGISAEKEKGTEKRPSNHRSKHPLLQVKRQLGFKVIYFVLGIGILVAMKLVSQNPTSRSLFDIVIGTFIICGFYLYVVWRRLPGRVEVGANLKESMTRAYKTTRRALRIEEGVGLFLYPLGAAAGMLWGREYRDPNFVADPVMDWKTLLIVIVVITPLAHFAAVWMNKVAFGKYLKHLKELIAQFDN